MKKLTQMLLVSVVVFNVHAYAQAKAASDSSPVGNTVHGDARRQLSDFVKNIHSATGRFEQVMLGHSFKPAQSGEFAFERPGRFVWKLTRPFEQHIISDGKVVYQYDPDLAQVTERAIQDAVGASPASILFGTGGLDQNFQVETLPNQGGMAWLRATPKVADAGMRYVDIAFADNLPAELRIVDSFGQTTKITLHDLKSNVKISASTFVFTAPQGVERVRLN